MPGFDSTGPAGNGSFGKGMGPCGGGQAGWGRGRGFRRGGGADWGRFPIAPSADDEKVFLEQQKGWLESQLSSISQRLQKYDNS